MALSELADGRAGVVNERKRYEKIRAAVLLSAVKFLNDYHMQQLFVFVCHE